MNNFTTLENKGRELFKSFLDQVGAIDQQPTEDQFNPVDYYFTYKGKNVVAEIKVRDEKCRQYNTHLIEDEKLKSIEKAKAENDCDNAFYANFIGENLLYIYSTSSIRENTEIEYLYCNRTTADDNGKVSKAVRMIPVEKSQKFEKIDGKWRK